MSSSAGVRKAQGFLQSVLKSKNLSQMTVISELKSLWLSFCYYEWPNLDEFMYVHPIIFVSSGSGLGRKKII